MQSTLALLLYILKAYKLLFAGKTNNDNVLLLYLLHDFQAPRMNEFLLTSIFMSLPGTSILVRRLTLERKLSFASTLVRNAGY